MNVSIIGAGSVSREYHIPVLKYLNFNLSVLIDNNSQILNEAIKFYNPKFAATDYETINATNTDLCIICTPTNSHFEIAYSLIKKGVNVLVEKPLVKSIEHARKLIELDGNGNAKCFVGQVRRFFPNIITLKKLISSNAFGKVLKVTISEGSPFTWNTFSDYLSDENDEGLITDTGAHIFDTISFLFDINLNNIDLYSCYVDKYPLTNNIYFAFKDKQSNIIYDIKISRNIKLSNKFLIHTEHGKLLTKPIFFKNEIAFIPNQDTKQKFYIYYINQKYNVRYAFVLQIESVFKALKEGNPLLSPIHISNNLNTIIFFEIIRKNFVVKPFLGNFYYE